MGYCVPVYALLIVAVLFFVAGFLVAWRLEVVILEKCDKCKTTTAKEKEKKY